MYAYVTTAGKLFAERLCDYDDYLRVAECYSDWGYDFTVVPHPGAVIWNMTTLVTFCR